MRSASTVARSEEIAGQLTASQCKAETALYFENAEGDWQLLEHLNEERGIDWDESGQRFDFANINLVPACATIQFEVLNPQGIYSPGSESDLDNVLDIDTRIKLKSGYLLEEVGEETNEAMSITEGLYGFGYYTKNTLGYIQPDADNSSGNTDIYFTDLFSPAYDSETYDDSTYTPAGYFVSTFPFTKRGLNQMNSFTVTANTTAGTIYYRTFNDRETFEANNQTSASWTNAGATINGTTEITISSGNEDKYIQVAIIYDGITWDDDVQVTDITLYYQSYIEWIYESVYYLDSPEYTDPSVPEFPLVMCSGRDAFKKAIETDLNLEDVNGDTPDEIIKSVCDAIGLGYTSTSIADLSAFGTRTLAGGLEDNFKAIDVFQKLIEICTQKGQTRYVMYTRYDSTIDDNILFVQPRPETFENFAAFSKNYLSAVGSKRKNYDRLMKRMTVVSKNGVADKSELLDSDTFTTTGTKTLSWSGDAEYKRFTVEVDGNATVTLDTTTPVNPTSIDFIITSGGGVFSVTINVYGNKWSSGAPASEGESINYSNMVNNRGQTRRIENLLVASDAEAQAIAEAFVEDYGNPSYEAGGLTYPYLYLLADLNDGGLIISPIVFINTIYIITGIKHHWDRSETPGDSSQFTLTDSGFTLDELLSLSWDEALKYDQGLLWDLSFALSETEDTTDYDYLLPVEFS